MGEIPLIEVRAPVHLLKEQAKVLHSLTNNDLTCEVVVKQGTFDFVYAFQIKVIKLNFEVCLFKIQYDLNLYPVEVHHLNSVSFCGNEAELEIKNTY